MAVSLSRPSVFCKSLWYVSKTYELNIYFCVLPCAFVNLLSTFTVPVPGTWGLRPLVYGALRGPWYTVAKGKGACALGD